MNRSQRERAARRQGRALRTGSVLVLVLVVVALLALGAYTFAEFMIVESAATATYGREVQARAAADSGIAQAVSCLAKRYEANSPSVYSMPDTFEAVVVRDSPIPKARCRFSVTSGDDQDTSGRTLRYGLADESAKINLNALAAWVAAGTITSAQAEALLTSLSPDLTPDIADAILDWIDPDQTAMANGVELDFYQGQNPSYPTKDNFLDSLSELLLVRGVTPTLLFGEDVNHNGVLDPGEDDGDGVLQRGWSKFLTVYSRENNLQPDGTPRININQTDLSALYSEVSQKFDVPTATFIIGYRVDGPGGGGGGGGGSSSSSSKSGSSGSSGSSSKSSSGSSGSGGSSKSGGGSSGSGGSGSMGGSSGGSGGSSKSGGGSSGGSSSGSSGGGSKSSSSSSSSKSSGGASAPPPATAMIQGIDVSNKGPNTFTSLYQLFGATTSPVVNGVTTQLKSPFPNTTAGISGNVLKIMQTLTLTDTPYIDGRININLAPQEVIMGLTNLGLSAMTPQVAQAIVGGQIKPSTDSSSTGDPPDRQTTAWLVTGTPMLSVNALETLDPFITARGDVFRLQSVGYFDGGGPMARVEAVIDASQVPPQVVFMRDLTELGHGFSSQLVSSGGGGSR